MKNKLLIILFCVSSFLFLDKVHALNTFSFSRVNYEIYDQNYEKISECTDSENFTTCDSGPSVPRIVMGLYNDSNSMTLVKDTEYTISIPANITYSSGSNVVVSISSISVQTTNDNWQVINFTNANYGGSSITFNYQPSSNIDIKGFVLDINFSPNAYYPSITITSPITYSLSKDYTGQLDNIQDELGNVKDELGQVGENIQGSIEDSTNEIKDKLDESFNTCRDSYNLLNYNVQNQTINGLNFTVNNDKTITIKGTATADTSYYLYDDINPLNLKIGNYTLSGVTGGSSITYRMLMYNLNWYLVAEDTGNGRTFTINNDTAVRLYIWVKSGTTVDTTVKPMLNEGNSAKPYEPYGEKICSNKLDDTNQAIGDLNQNITNGNIDSNTGSDFFNNFTTEDNGGISGIVTAPLTLINSLLDNQNVCIDLKFPVLGKEVSLPSGCIIWDKVPSNIEVLIQTLVCGTGAYFLLRKMFKDIEDLKNPNKSEVSTLDL